MIMIALIWPAAAIAITAMLSIAALKAWRGWLDLKRLEIAAEGSTSGGGNPGLRIEMAAIRDRLRKLEEIATGVDL